MLDFVVVMATIFCFFILPVYVFAIWKEKNKQKVELESNLVGKSLTTGELESMIETSVRDAMVGIEDRLRVLEHGQAGVSVDSNEELPVTNQAEKRSKPVVRTVGRSHT